MARGTTTFGFQTFGGATRQLIIAIVATFFVIAILGVVAPVAAAHLLGWLWLSPAGLTHGQIWRLLTYSFLPTGILGTIFAVFTLWSLGNLMEARYSSRWLMEFYLLTAAVAGLIASLLALTGLPRLDPKMFTMGPWSPVMALLVAFATVSAEEMISLFGIISMKVKYLVAFYVLLYLGLTLVGGDPFGALTCLCGALAGWLYMRFAPRRGFLPNARFSFSERYYALRNEFYRRKRRNAAKKFEVYMGKQGREVHFDKEGRYVAPDEKRDPTDKRWMN